VGRKASREWSRLSRGLIRHLAAKRAMAHDVFAMMRSSGFALFLSIGLVSSAIAQTATPGTGGVGSATLRNGFPAGSGAAALPTIQNSSTTLATPTPGTATASSATGTTTSTVATGAPASSSTSSTAGTSGGNAGGSSGAASTTGTTGAISGRTGTSTSAASSGSAAASGGAAAGGGGTARGGSASTAGAATPTASSNSGPAWVMCPPSGANGLEPLFTGTDLSCAPQ
jgi:hypothetical protein